MHCYPYYPLDHLIDTKFVALVIPSSPGALFDLVSNQHLAGILNAFIREASEWFILSTWSYHLLCFHLVSS